MQLWTENNFSGQIQHISLTEQISGVGDGNLFHWA
jgi:hypothetical protein